MRRWYSSCACLMPLSPVTVLTVTKGSSNRSLRRAMISFKSLLSWTITCGWLWAKAIGVGEDAVLRKFVQAECKVKHALTLLRRRQIYSYIFYRRPLLQRCLFSVYRQYHKKNRLVYQTKVSQPIRP